ncbi:MAG: YfhO family protein [Verrucomicrobiota bacterium]|nr:YfhO family protein [Verrucomicrobiota bacterium]
MQPAGEFSKRLGPWGFAALVGVLLVAVFWDILASDRVLYPLVDGSPIFPLNYSQAIRDGFTGGWGGELVGQGWEAAPLCPAKLLAAFLPPMIQHTLGYMLDFILLAVATVYFLRGRGLCGWATFLPGLAMGFSGYTFTLISAGHREFCDMMPFAVFTLACLDRAVTRQSVFYVAWAGLAAAFGVVSQPDVMGLFGLLTIVYGSFLLIRQWMNHPDTRKGLLVTVLLGGLVASACFAAVALSGKAFLTRVVSARAVVRGETSEQKWIFATNWSLPPEDMAEFLVPCVFGVQSGDPKGPYWGRLGRPFGWDRHRQGMVNYRQHTVYLGGIQLVFAAYACVWAARLKRRKGSGFGVQAQEGGEAWDGRDVNLGEEHWDRRAQAWFWAVVAVACATLALGRHFIVYRFFYLLPYLSMIRCPVKFVHLVEVAVAILFAFGLSAFVADLRMAGRSLDRDIKGKVVPAVASAGRSASRALLWFGVGCAALALLLWIGAGLVRWNKSVFHAYWRSLGRGFEPYFDVMMANMTGAFVHAGFVMLAAGAAFLLGRFFLGRKSVHTLVVAGLVLVVSLDIISVSRRYIPIGDIRPWYAPNPVTDRIQADPPSRVWSLFDLDPRIFTSRNWFFGSFLVRSIPLLPLGENMGQSQDWPDDYKAFFGALQKEPLRLWSLTNSRFLVGPRQRMSQFAGHSEFEPALTFDAVGARVVPTEGAKGQDALVRFNRALPRALVYHAWDQMSAEEALATLPKREWNPWKSVLVSGGLPSRQSALVPSQAQIVGYRSNRVAIEVDAPEDGVLLLNDKYDPDWVARVDGVKKPLLRCNYIMRGVQVSAGKHRVVFTYYPCLAPFLISLGACVAMLVWTAARLARHRRQETEKASRKNNKSAKA